MGSGRMYFDLDELDIKIKKEIYFSYGMIFTYQGEDYYYKGNKTLDSIYNEILAKKIADKLGISCCEYYLGSYYEDMGSISKMISDDKFISMSNLLLSSYGITKNKNNIEDINAMLDNIFSSEVSEKLKSDLLNIFLFDVLIGNCDRNSDNYGLILDDNPRFAPLFDNENMLSEYSIYYGNYTLGIDEDDLDDENILDKLFEHFPETKDRLRKMFPIISEESLENIFKELEDEYEINDYIKEKVMDRFSINRGMINESLNKKVKRIEL